MADEHVFSRNILLAIIVALVTGIGLAFFFEYLDNSIKNGEDLERTAGIPALGLIPVVMVTGVTGETGIDLEAFFKTPPSPLLPSSTSQLLNHHAKIQALHPSPPPDHPVRP